MYCILFNTYTRLLSADLQYVKYVLLKHGHQMLDGKFVLHKCEARNITTCCIDDSNPCVLNT